jgi:TRAP-type C4-dicarboxylate transport system permease small subunit
MNDWRGRRWWEWALWLSAAAAAAAVLCWYSNRQLDLALDRDAPATAIGEYRFVAVASAVTAVATGLAALVLSGWKLLLYAIREIARAVRDSPKDP